MKELLWTKLTSEYKKYQLSILALTKTEIFAKCYEIDCMINFYEIMIEKVEKMEESTVMALLKEKDILWHCYNSWLTKDDSNYREMEEHIKEELKTTLSNHNYCSAA